MPGDPVVPAVVKIAGSTPGLQVRRFLDAHLSEMVDAALATVPADCRGTVVAHASQDGVGLSVMARLGHQWSVVGTLSKGFSEPLEVGAVVRFNW